MSQEGGKIDAHMESFRNVPEMKICPMGIKHKLEGLWWLGRCRRSCYRKNQLSRLGLFQMESTHHACGMLAVVMMLMSREAVQHCARPSLPWLLFPVDTTQSSLTFINSWQRAAPEFPMIPPVLCVILPHLSLFARSHSVLLMEELLTLFLVLCSLDAALIFPACVIRRGWGEGLYSMIEK